MERTVPQPPSAQTRPDLKAFEARTFPVIGLPPTARSIIFPLTDAQAPVFRRGQGVRRSQHTVRSEVQPWMTGVVIDRVGDALAQRLRHLLPAALGDHDAELSLEVERLDARGAGVQMGLDDVA